MEGFLAHGVVQRIVVDFDVLGLHTSAVNNAGHLAGVTQAAARSGPLQAALESGEFHG